MRRHIALLVLFLAGAAFSISAEEEAAPAQSEPSAQPAAAAAPAAAPAASATQTAPAAHTTTQAAPAAHSASQPAPTPRAQPQASASAPSAPAAGAAKPDALLLYQQGRNLETAGRQADAQAKYNQAITVCDKEMQSDPRRIESYVVKCWSLFRMNRHSEVISTGQAGLKVSFDARISEVMGESYYFLGQMDQSLKALQHYMDAVGDSGDRGPTALFFMGEVYLRLKKYAHADMAYSAALRQEPSMTRWWFRLGNACEGLGDWKRAYDAYGKVLALVPGSQDAKDGQARVKPKLSQPQPQ